MQALCRIGPLGLASTLALGVAVAALAAPGDLDPTFGVNGRVVLSPGTESYATAATLQADGKILLAGLVDDQEPPPPPPPAPFGLRVSNADFLAARLNADGSLDSSFGAGGIVRTPIDLGNSRYDRAWAVAAGPGGTVVLGGDAITPGGTRDLAFARYTSSGILDSSFSGDGIQTLDVGMFDSVEGVAVQPDGKIVAVGRAGTGFTVVRLQVDGSLDATFGSDGIVNTPIGNPALQDEAVAVVLLGDGRVLVAGTADYEYPYPTDFALARYLPDGRLDQGFGMDGIVVTHGAGEEMAHALALTPSGGIVLAGAGGDRAFRLARYRPAGALDPTFGSGGIVSTQIGTLYSEALAVAVQADGKVIAGGTSRDGPPGMAEFALARYRVDGSLDPSFGVRGKRTFDLLAGNDLGWALVVQPGAGSGRSTDRLVQIGLGSDGDGLAEHVVGVGLDLGPPGQPIPIRCRVPRVVHRRLAAARSRIRRANCRVGRIRRVRARRFRGVVVAQSPRAGRILRRGARVNLVVGRR